jgi:hypothetical protein
MVVVTLCVITVKFLTKHKETGCKLCAIRGLPTLLLLSSNKNMSIRRKITHNNTENPLTVVKILVNVRL